MRSTFEKKEVKENIPGVLLLSHGPLALSLVESAEMIFGKADNVSAFSLDYGDDVAEYADSFVEALQSYKDGCVILVDLLGGTPCNQLLIYAKRNNKKFNIVSGANLPMLINVLALRGQYGNDIPALMESFRADIPEYVKDISSYC